MAKMKKKAKKTKKKSATAKMPPSRRGKGAKKLPRKSKGQRGKATASGRSRGGARSARPAAPALAEVIRRIRTTGVRPTVDPKLLQASMRRMGASKAVPFPKEPEERRESVPAMKPQTKRFHGAKVSLGWFPFPLFSSKCADRFGYMSSPSVRNATRLPFNVGMRALLNELGDLMGDPGREVGVPDSTLPAGFTYVGQFVDHDITLDVSSSLDSAADARTIPNMRTPALDLDSLYGRGPALQPYLYEFPTSGNPTAIKFQMGTNQAAGPGGPAGSAGTPGGMTVKTFFDVPRSRASNTALIGDPRNDENLIVSQFHQTMLQFHNAVVDLLVLIGFSADIFVEAKRIVTQHYQWAVVHDLLKRVCGTAAVTSALSSVTAGIGSAFSMPVEFSVGAYRFGHTMVRDQYWINFNFPTASLGQVFEFIRNPRLPVLSNWVVDFNAFFDTGVVVPVNNKARSIDSVLASGLESLPGFSGLMAVLARRNLLRGLALGLPSGQGMAGSFGITPLTPAQLSSGLPTNEVKVLEKKGGILLRKTPLWYYVLREAAVLGGGSQLGPVGAKIVADTFVRMLKRDKNSYLRAGGFTPSLPSATPGDFTFADLVIFAGVTEP